MLVCRYFSDNNAVKTLQSLLFKVTNPNDLNDPFENSPYFKKSEEQEWECYLKEDSIIEELYNLAHRQFGITKEEFLKKWEAGARQKVQTALMQTDLMKSLDRVKNEFSKENKILCVSDATAIEPYGDILMWAHYSNGHKGIKISFDTEKIGWNDLKIDQVEYSEDRVMLDPIKIHKGDPTVKDDIKRALIVKSLGWKYEQEYRWFIQVQKCELDTEKNIHFVKIPAEAIISVDIGVKALPQIKEGITDLMRENDLSHIEIRHAKLHETKFTLNYETQKFT
ncbi:MAG: hypothetical protein NPIRA03_34680 [Nitrospirales bacterium]|nr:MAG: hypothetical protein NPIRA03_34680 [Nitrospirales bacterium]